MLSQTPQPITKTPLQLANTDASQATTIPSSFSSLNTINRPPDAPDAGVFDPPLQRLFDDYFVSFMGGMLQQSGLDPVVWRDIAVQLCQVHLLPTQFHTHPPLQSCNPTSSPPPPPPPYTRNIAFSTISPTLVRVVFSN